MASAKAAAHASAAAEPAAHVAATEPAAHMSATTEPPAPPPPPPRANASAVSPPARAAAVAKTIMVLRNIGSTPSDATASIRLKTQSGHCTKVWTNG
jgi:hypothetical protein